MLRGSAEISTGESYGRQAFQSLAGLRPDFEQPVGVLLGLAVIFSRHGKRDEVRQHLHRTRITGQQLPVNLGSFVQFAELLESDSLAEQGPVLAGAGAKRLVEVFQRLGWLTEMQQAQAAAGVRLPEARIQGQRLIERAIGLIELALAFQCQAEIVVRRSVVGLRGDYFGVAGRRLSPLLLFETKMPEPGINLAGILPARRSAFQFFDRLIQAAGSGELHGFAEG